MAGPCISVKELNAKNRRFWELESAKAQRRIADAVVFRRAVADIDAETRRLIPEPNRKSFEQALPDAEALYEDPAFKQRARRQLSQLGGSAKKTDRLQALILGAVRRKPSITKQQLLWHLESLKHHGVVEDIADGIIHFTNHGGRAKEALISGLEDRLWRAKKAINSV